MITLKAPAKINLTLEVLRKRPDGFHEIRSVLQTVDLSDTLYIQSGKGISFRCDMDGWSAQQSLLSRVVALLQEETGCTLGADVRIEKRIPLLSGLGGDSSGAAALLKGLNELWKLNLSDKKLTDLASQLGSDVAFFLKGGTALAQGRGEILSPLPPPQKLWVLLVFPDIHVGPGKTARMYASLKPSHFTDGSITQKLAESLKKGKPFDGSLLFNTFENVAFEIFNGLDVYKEHLVKLGAPVVHLAGSGPTLFTLVEDKSVAEDLHKRCKNQGIRSCLTNTL
jgi:4-diphosphocytidyl-2-C-methyl-D-erythritol kinase